MLGFACVTVVPCPRCKLLVHTKKTLHVQPLLHLATLLHGETGNNKKDHEQNARKNIYYFSEWAPHRGHPTLQPEKGYKSAQYIHAAGKLELGGNEVRSLKRRVLSLRLHPALASRSARRSANGLTHAFAAHQTWHLPIFGDEFVTGEPAYHDSGVQAC